ncbi:hypothetical protein BDW02DRAFT_465225, partial [Decorospora gaudefroyi]
EQGFISFADGGNNFGALNRGGRFDVEEGPEDEELTDSDLTDLDALSDQDMYDAEEISINVDVRQPKASRGRPPRATVMYTVPEAVAVYEQLRVSGFPLVSMLGRTRYGLYLEDASSASAAAVAFAPTPISRLRRVSRANSEEPIAQPELPDPEPEAYNPARDYVFTRGPHAGKRFDQVDDMYLRTIGGQLYRFTKKKYPGLREAFEYHKPGQARRVAAPKRPTRVSQAPEAPPQRAPPQTEQPAPRGRQNPRPAAPTPSDTYRFPKGKYEGKRFYDVKEEYIRTLESRSDTLNSWPGFRRALQDFNAKT